MNRNIRLSKRASRNLEKLLDYLETEWSHKVKLAFIDKLDSGFTHLSQFPESHPKSNLKKDLHRFVLTRQTTIYYKFNSKSLFIVTLFDTRQSPKKLKRETS
jgi:plasmid stabilization system protein ParE